MKNTSVIHSYVEEARLMQNIIKSILSKNLDLAKARPAQMIFITTSNNAIIVET